MSDQNAYLGNAYGRFYTGIGCREDRPFKILAPITTLSFGDTFVFASAAARVAAAFEYSHCRFLAHHSRPYFRDILSLHPFPSTVDIVETDWRQLAFSALVAPTQGLDWREAAYQDIVLTSAWLSPAHFGDLPRCPLVFPDPLAAALAESLLRMGLSDANWFCVLHWREPTYVYKASANLRDVDPQRYLPLIDHVIDELGGQVVLCGHPEMTRPKPRAGLVDLAGIANSWMLQAFATSRARFFAGSPSGITGVAHAFLTPSAHLDVLDWYTGEAEDWLMTPTLHLPDGRNLRGEDLFQSGWMHSMRIAKALRDGQLITQTKSETGEMIRALEQLFRDTQDVFGWRKPAPVPTKRPNALRFPPGGGYRPRFIPL